jgi:hypothetical protein
LEADLPRKIPVKTHELWAFTFTQILIERCL